MLKISIICGPTLLVLIFFPSISYAYFDPGTASFIIQSIIAFLGSVLVFISNPIRFIKNFIKKIKEKKSGNEKKNSDKL